MLRSKITGAPWNPRRIADQERAKLKAGIEDEAIGLLEPLVWNKRTGTLVGGHQRLEILDGLMRTKNYLVPCSVVDLDEKTEKEACVLLNNESAQGDWDLEKFGALFKGPDKIDHEKAGLDLGDMYALFGETALHESPAEMMEMAERVRKAKALQQQVLEKRATRDADNFYACLMYRMDDGEQKRIVCAIFKDFEELAQFADRKQLEHIYVEGQGVANIIFVNGVEFEKMLDAQNGKKKAS